MAKIWSWLRRRPRPEAISHVDSRALSISHVDSRVQSVFSRIDGEPVIEDKDHRYRELCSISEIMPFECRRRVLRRGIRVTSGISHYLDLEMGSAQPLSRETTSRWKAFDKQTGRELAVETIDAPDYYRKVRRIFFDRPLREGEEFHIETLATLPMSEVDGIGCVGVKLRGYLLGVDLVRARVCFQAPAPPHFRAFVSRRQGEISRAPFTIDRGMEATSSWFEVVLTNPHEQQILFAWDRRGQQVAHPEETIEPLKILFLAANPKFLAPLDLEHELRNIKVQLATTTGRDSVELIAEGAVTPDDLVRHVRDHSPAVVHFSGHGSPLGVFLREESSNSYRSVSGDSLRRFFDGRGVRLVVFNSCSSNEQARAVSKVVDVVVGTSSSLGNEAAKIFSGAFYRSLANGLSVGESLRDGTDSVELRGLQDVFEIMGDEDVKLI